MSNEKRISELKRTNKTVSLMGLPSQSLCGIFLPHACHLGMYVDHISWVVSRHSGGNAKPFDIALEEAFDTTEVESVFSHFQVWEDIVFFTQPQCVLSAEEAVVFGERCLQSSMFWVQIFKFKNARGVSQRILKVHPDFISRVSKVEIHFRFVSFQLCSCWNEVLGLIFAEIASLISMKNQPSVPLSTCS